jgi:hypothetical protein
MSLILLAAALSGMLSAKLMLFLHVDSMVIRYPLAVLASYLAFFLFVRLWLMHVSASQRLRDSDPAGDVLSGLPDLSEARGAGAGAARFGGGGGASGGGGATGAFDGPAANARAGFVPSSSRAPDASSGTLGKAGDAMSGIFDDDAIILIALGVLLAAVFGAAIYLVYIAPHVLSEAAFDFLLGTGLVRSCRKMDRPGWVGSVLRDTYKPFLAVLMIAFIAAWVIHAHDPGITKLSDLFAR